MQNKHQVFHFNRHKSSKASMYVTPTYLVNMPTLNEQWYSLHRVTVISELFTCASFVCTFSYKYDISNKDPANSFGSPQIRADPHQLHLNLLKDDINVKLNPECQSCCTLAQNFCKELVFILQIINLLKRTLPFDSSGSESGPISGKGTGQMRTAVLAGLI